MNEIAKSHAPNEMPKVKIPLLWQGIFWKIFSCGCFAGTNAIVKYLLGGSSLKLNWTPLPFYTIMLFQNLIGLVLLLPLLRSAFRKKLFATNYPFLNIVRVLTAVIGIGLWYLSMRYMPITVAVALSFSGPIITIVGCKLFLHEHFNWQRVVAVSLSLVGGFFIMRPDKGLLAAGGAIGIAAILPLAAATIFAGDKLISRKLMASKESPFVLTFYLLLGTTICCFVASIFYGFVAINAMQLKWLVILGILGILAHYAFNKAYVFAEVTYLMPFGAAKIILSGIAGYCAFGELPNSMNMWIGMSVIFLSSIILNYRQNSAKTAA